MPPLPAAFRLPPHGLPYIKKVFQRSEALAHAGVWAGVDVPRIQRWRANFVGDEEAYFAACVLDALIYRSAAQTAALMKQLFQRAIPEYCRRNLPAYAGADILRLLSRRRQQGDPGIRIVPVIRSSDPPTKSGPVLARLYRRDLRFADNWMIWPWQVPTAIARGIRAFIFIDDFLGTGNQFVKFMEQFELRQSLIDATAIYAPLTAHRTGVSQLARVLPEIHLQSAELLEPEHGLFAVTSPYFQDSTNGPEIARFFYDRMLNKRGIRLKRDERYGYGSLGLAYAFEHAVPNNTLPILWTKRMNWQPLFER